MQPPLIDPADLFRLVHFFDVLAAIVFAVSGALVAIAMGVVTGCFGGIIRDTLGHVPSILLKHEIYVTASVLGACAYVALNAFEPARLPAMIAGFIVTFGVRGLAIKFGWSLPVFRESVTRGRWNTPKRD